MILHGNIPGLSLKRKPRASGDDPYRDFLNQKIIE